MPVDVKWENQKPSNGVSVIISTKRQKFLHNVFANYRRQLYPKRELIIIITNRMDMKKYTTLAKRHLNVSVYRVDEKVPLGECLNMAVSTAKYSIITKFDDDDYYSPYYLNGVVSCFKKSGAKVLGKNTCYLYLKQRNLLLLFHPNRTHQSTDLIMGSTLSFYKSVFAKVKFQHVSKGEDTYFLRDCEKEGMTIYSCDPFNYVCIRRTNGGSHTWQIDEKTLIEHSKVIGKMTDFTKYVTRVVRVPCEGAARRAAGVWRGPGLRPARGVGLQ